MVKAYKDTKVDLRPFSPNTVLNISTPSATQDSYAQRRTRFAASPLSNNEEIPPKDDNEFYKRYLATQGSVYFRKRRVYPRSFLWRVVNDSKVLEIQCADLTKNGLDRNEYNVTLRLDFQEEILPAGVGFADLEDHDVLNAFVITASKQLHTLTLRPEWFRRKAAVDEKVSDWWKSCVPAPLSFSHPHRLHVSSPLELFISLDNGSLLRLTRRSGDDGIYPFKSCFSWLLTAKARNGILLPSTREPGVRRFAVWLGGRRNRRLNTKGALSTRTLQMRLLLPPIRHMSSPSV